MPSFHKKTRRARTTKRTRRSSKKIRQRGGGIKEIVFVSGNENKRKEFQEILHPITVISKKVDLPEIQSTEVEEVIKKKTLAGKEQIDGPFFVEDTGLYIDSKPMNGFPGALIKFYFEHLGLAGICCKNGSNTAYAKTIIGFYDGKEVHTFEGRLYGKIAEEPQKGDYGFGWDEIFIPTEHDPENKKSLAQMTKEEKNAISHRSKAGQAFKAYLDTINTERPSVLIMG